MSNGISKNDGTAGAQSMQLPYGSGQKDVVTQAQRKRPNNETFDGLKKNKASAVGTLKPGDISSERSAPVRKPSEQEYKIPSQRGWPKIFPQDPPAMKLRKGAELLALARKNEAYAAAESYVELHRPLMPVMLDAMECLLVQLHDSGDNGGDGSRIQQLITSWKQEVVPALKSEKPANIPAVLGGEQSRFVADVLECQENFAAQAAARLSPPAPAQTPPAGAGKSVVSQLTGLLAYPLDWFRKTFVSFATEAGFYAPPAPPVAAPRVAADKPTYGEIMRAKEEREEILLGYLAQIALEPPSPPVAPSAGFLPPEEEFDYSYVGGSTVPKTRTNGHSSAQAAAADAIEEPTGRPNMDRVPAVNVERALRVMRAQEMEATPKELARIAETLTSQSLRGVTVETHSRLFDELRLHVEARTSAGEALSCSTVFAFLEAASAATLSRDEKRAFVDSLAENLLAEPVRVADVRNFATLIENRKAFEVPRHLGGMDPFNKRLVLERLLELFKQAKPHVRERALIESLDSRVTGDGLESRCQQSLARAIAGLQFLARYPDARAIGEEIAGVYGRTLEPAVLASNDRAVWQQCAVNIFKGQRNAEPYAEFPSGPIRINAHHVGVNVLEAVLAEHMRRPDTDPLMLRRLRIVVGSGGHSVKANGLTPLLRTILDATTPAGWEATVVDDVYVDVTHPSRGNRPAGASLEKMFLKPPEGDS